MSNILVTGANRGIGLELVKQLAEAGNTVYAACRNPDSAEALNALAETTDIKVIQLDAGSDASAKQLAKDLDGVVIDVLINNAGVGGPAKQNAFEVDFDGFAEVMNVNVFGPIRVMHALMPNLKLAETPKVVNISSQMGALSLDMTMAHAYCSSKAALNKYMKLAAIDLAKEGILVSLLHPGWVQTDMGGKGADITPAESASGIINTIDMLTPETTGSFWKWNGETHEW